MSLNEFNNIKVKFHSDEDPKTKQSIDLVFGNSAFEETDMPLFQMAAHE